MKQPAAREPAQSLLEFAFVLPLFLLLLFGVIDFSRLLFSHISLANGTRELARQAAISSSTSATAPLDAFRNYTLLGGAFNGATAVTLSPAAGGGLGFITCSGMSGSGCSVNAAGSTAGTTLTLLLTPASANAAGAATFTMPLASWNPRSFVNTTNSGDYVVITVLNKQYSGKLLVCPLPLQDACALPSRTASTDGVLQVDLYYNFVFSPLFQNRLAGVITTSFMRQVSAIGTSVRTYIE
ncbi:MAG: pilus assembly protein [Chloroflexota bacterium]|nr:pilus assembly protein [Chloroflexota bacterium]